MRSSKGQLFPENGRLAVTGANRFLDERLCRGQSGKMRFRRTVDNRVSRIVRSTDIVRGQANHPVQAVLCEGN